MTELEALSALRGDDLRLAARAAAALWEMWHRSGDPPVDSLLREGIEAIERQDLSTAEAAFTRLIKEMPAFAEGWNKRATVRYLAKDYVGSIADCLETLARNPNHFGAQVGLTPAVAVPEPNTWNELLSELDLKLPVASQRVAIQEYGVRNEEFLAALRR